MRILLIATYLPPYSGSGNIRLLNYINYLSRLGNKVDVVGVEYPKNSIAYDETLEGVFDKEVDIYRVNPGFLYNLFNRKKVDVSSKNEEASTKRNRNELANKVKQKINYFIKTTFLIPDSFVGWIKPAYKMACNLIENNKYDLIFSIHETPSSHIVGYKLKKKFKNIKWIGYWSDPWNGDSALRSDSSFVKKSIDEYLERKVIRRTDKLMFTTKSTQKMYVDKYNLEVSKTEVVYRGYEPTLYDEIKLSKELPEGIEKDKINIVHTGTIYKGLRDIRPLVNALNSLKATDRDTYNKINVIFVGQFTDPEDERLLSQVSCVKIINYVPFKVAMQYVVHADILLLYGNKNSTQVPGKVYEYIGSEAVIMTILGCEKDELNEIMKDMNKGPVLLNEELLITNELSKLVANFQNINGEWKQVCAKFQWINVVIDLQDKLFKH